MPAQGGPGFKASSVSFHLCVVGHKTTPLPVFPAGSENGGHILAGRAFPAQVLSLHLPSPFLRLPLRGSPARVPFLRTQAFGGLWPPCPPVGARESWDAFCPRKAQGGQACPVGQEWGKHKREDSGVSNGRAVGGPPWAGLHPLLPPSCPLSLLCPQTQRVAFDEPHSPIPPPPNSPHPVSPEVLPTAPHTPHPTSLSMCLHPTLVLQPPSPCPLPSQPRPPGGRIKWTVSSPWLLPPWASRGLISKECRSPWDDSVDGKGATG